MTLDKLIERLTECREEVGRDAEVKIMSQTNFPDGTTGPLENNLAGVCTGQEINFDHKHSNHKEYDDQDVPHDNVVYIVGGDKFCFGSKRAWRVAR